MRYKVDRLRELTDTLKKDGFEKSRTGEHSLAVKYSKKDIAFHIYLSRVHTDEKGISYLDEKGISYEEDEPKSI